MDFTQSTTLTFYVFSDERVLHDVPSVRSQDFLKLRDVVVLVGAEETTHEC